MNISKNRKVGESLNQSKNVDTSHISQGQNYLNRTMDSGNKNDASTYLSGDQNVDLVNFLESGGQLRNLNDYLKTRKFKAEAPEFQEAFVHVYQEAQRMETMIKTLYSEIRHLSKLNKYLNLSQKHKEEMLCKILEENRKLTEELQTWKIQHSFEMRDKNYDKTYSETKTDTYSITKTNQKTTPMKFLKAKNIGIMSNTDKGFGGGSAFKLKRASSSKFTNLVGNDSRNKMARSHNNPFFTASNKVPIQKVNIGIAEKSNFGKTVDTTNNTCSECHRQFTFTSRNMTTENDKDKAAPMLIQQNLDAIVESTTLSA